MAEIDGLRAGTPYRDRVVAVSGAGRSAVEGPAFRTAPGAVVAPGGGDWRQLFALAGGALVQKTTVKRAADGSDGRKALVWSTPGGTEIGRLRATDVEWRAMFELLGLK